MTPLGFPVDPEVKKINMGCSFSILKSGSKSSKLIV